jgi:plastocyanin
MTFALACLMGALCASAQAKNETSSPGEPTPVETRIKIIPKPVPCVPCPCECPDPRTVAASQLGVPPERGPGSGLAEEPRQSEPDRMRPGGPAQRELEARPTPPPPPPRGIIAGEVIVRDRGGKEKSDRSEVVVYIEKVPRRFAALKRVRRMAQRDKAFTPRVMAVTKGSTVEFPNEDKFFHNVFSLSEGNTFDLGLYRAGTSKSVTFEKSGVVDVYCNIHPNMWAQILVLENPFYAVTGKEGTFELPKLPPGTYTVAAWISGGELVKQQVKVEAGGRVNVKLEVKEGSSSKPHLNKFNEPYGRYK